jgi:large subunit ribosomal protein L10
MIERIYPKQKVDNLEQFSKLIADSNSIFLADFSGMTVEEITLMRNKFYQNGIEFKVIKNTLAKKALHKAGIEQLDPYLKGVNGFAFGHKDPSLPAKIMFDFAKAEERPQVRSCILEGQIYGPDKIALVKDLPTREQIIVELIGQIQAPVSSFVGTLNEIVRGFLGVLDAIIQKKSLTPEMNA